MNARSRYRPHMEHDRAEAAGPPRAEAAGPPRAEAAAQLRDAVDAAVTGQGRLILLAGEPGIGKTTQLGGAARHAAGRGVRTAWGWGSPAEGAPAYWPWTQVLRELELDPL